MIDRELLELAAKAVGIPTIHLYPTGGQGALGWNPLEDDGDALRLAVKLRLTIQHNYSGVFCYDTPDFADKSRKTIEVYEGHRSCDATRRAIVCVAAEIAKATGKQP